MTAVQAFELVYRTGDGILKVQGNPRGDGLEFVVEGFGTTIWIPLDEFSTRDFLLALHAVAVPAVVGPAER